MARSCREIKQACDAVINVSTGGTPAMISLDQRLEGSEGHSRPRSARSTWAR